MQGVHYDDNKDSALRVHYDCSLGKTYQFTAKRLSVHSVTTIYSLGNISLLIVQRRRERGMNSIAPAHQSTCTLQRQDLCARRGKRCTAGTARCARS
jgi:hypothetical protein